MKDTIKKALLVSTLSFVLFPPRVHASAVNTTQSISVDVVDISKEESKQTIEANGEKENKRISQEETHQRLGVNSKDATVSASLGTPQSKARGTVIENVGTDNQPYPIRKDSKTATNTTDTSKNTPTQSKERPSSDARQFVTFQTKSGKVFHLIIDHDKSSENVQLVTEVSESDLLNMIETKEVKEVPKTEVIKEAPKEEKKESKKQSGFGSYVILGLVLVGALGAGYYFKIVKPKQEDDFDYGDEESDEDDFFVEDSTDELKEEEDE